MASRRAALPTASYVEKGARFISNSYAPWVKSGAEGYLKTLNAAIG